MKTKEHDSMMAYLTRKPNILSNNINSKKISHTGRPGFAKGTKSDTTPTSKNGRMLEYINDINIIYGDKKATNAEKDAAANRQTLREATPDQLAKLQKRLDNARAFVTPPKDTMSFTDEYNMLYNKKSPKYYKKVVKGPKPTPNGPTTLTSDDWNLIIDSTDFPYELFDDEWMKPKKRVQVEENLFDKYIEMLKAGELLPGTTFEMFEKSYYDFDTDVISKINKRVREKKKAEGIAALLSLSPDRI